MQAQRTPRYAVDAETGCWVWQRCKTRDGYGSLNAEGRTWLAHRYYWTQANGPIAPGLEADHVCHNRACVNPGHIRLVTHRENTQNRRGGRGASSHRGVHWHKKNGCWVARVMVDGVSHYLGSFAYEEHAARAASEFRAHWMPGALA